MEIDMRIICQPYFNQHQVKLFDAASGTPGVTLNMNPVHAGFDARPNSLASYRDPSTGIDYLFVSCIDTDDTNHVDIYNMSDARAGGSPAPLRRLTFPNGVVGLAVQPGTGDLYIATFADADSSGGVFYAKRAPAGGGQPYSALLNFSNYNDDPTVAKYSANLAFDPHGNLWMTTFDEGGAFLICYTSVPADKSQYYKLTNGAKITAKGLNGSTAPAGGMLALSQPEGIAFDAWGNLWLANNSDDYALNGSGSGSLLLLNNTALAKVRTHANGSSIAIDSTLGGVTTYYLANSKFGGVAFDGATLYVNDQEAGKVWKSPLIVVGTWGVITDLATTTLTDSLIPTTYPGNGQMVLVDTAPPTLRIRDWMNDAGAEPSNPPGGVLWESPDMSLFIPADDMSTLMTVVVTNKGSAPTSGTEMLRTYWATASAGLAWPAPWDGFAPTLVGGQIGATPIGVIQPGDSKSLSFHAVPGTNIAPYQAGLHFCLLARIETTPLYPFGMDHPETTPAGGNDDLGVNVADNQAIGWHNVVYPPAGTPATLIVRPANYGLIERILHLKVELLDHTGRSAPVPGRLTVRAEGKAGERLNALVGTKLAAIDRRHWQVHDLANAVRDIRLAPHEALPLHFAFTPQRGIEDYAIRFIQTETRHGTEHVVGGQTFVFGTVRGFLPPRRPRVAHPNEPARPAREAEPA
jgi:hypothetical protein